MLLAAITEISMFQPTRHRPLWLMWLEDQMGIIQDVSEFPGASSEVQEENILHFREDRLVTNIVRLHIP
jgi:hypothetical protein